MATKIFINLPVQDLARSMHFFEQLGFTFNPQFTDDKAACMIVGDNIFAMLLVEPYFKTFLHDTDISDARKTTEVLLTLDAPSREAVRQTIERAQSLGGRVYATAADHGWMYQHSFADLDGHKWEVAYMDMTQIPGQ